MFLFIYFIFLVDALPKSILMASIFGYKLERKSTVLPPTQLYIPFSFTRVSVSTTATSKLRILDNLEDISSTNYRVLVCVNFEVVV